MEEYLYARGLITRAQYNHVRLKRLSSPRRIAALLVAEGFIKPQELFGVVRGNLEECVFGLFEWENGTYRYAPEIVPEEERVALDRDPPAVILEGYRRKHLLPRMMRRVGAPSSLLTIKPDRGSVETEGLGLTSEEHKVARLVDGSHSIEDIVFSTGLEPPEVYAVLSALLAIGFAEVSVVGIDGQSRAGASPADAIDQNRIREKLCAVREQDYFHILSVSPNATPYELDRAFERMRKEFAPERYSEQIQRDFRDELQEIQAVLDDAHAVLKDRTLRDAYARNLATTR
jgi:hypothetical protein